MFIPAGPMNRSMAGTARKMPKKRSSEADTPPTGSGFIPSQRWVGPRRVIVGERSTGTIITPARRLDAAVVS